MTRRIPDVIEKSPGHTHYVYNPFLSYFDDLLLAAVAISLNKYTRPWEVVRRGSRVTAYEIIKVVDSASLCHTCKKRITRFVYPIDETKRL